MAPTPNVRNFAAWINKQPPGPANTIVRGEVETPTSAHLPHIAARTPFSVLDKVLILDLTIQNTGGIGTQAFQYHDTRFEIKASQYETAEIYWEGAVLITLEIGSAF